MSVRELHILEALTSVRRFTGIAQALTAEELVACLDFEVSTRRRPSLINKLIDQAARLNNRAFLTALRKKYHGN